MIRTLFIISVAGFLLASQPRRRRSPSSAWNRSTTPFGPVTVILGVGPWM